MKQNPSKTDDKFVKAETDSEAKAKKEKKKVKLTQTQVFWMRFAGWLVFALVMPLVILQIYFHIFSWVNDGTSSVSAHLAVSGWGIIGILVLVFVLRAIINYEKKDLPWSMTVQVLNGITKVILPLFAVLGIAWLAESFVERLPDFIASMGWITVSEAVAIPINPFPLWLYQRARSARRDEAKDQSSDMWDMFFSKKEQHDDEKGKGK